MRESGGFFYHYLALRNSLRMWQPYVQSLNDVILESSILETPSLAWIGPSAAYSLKRELLSARINSDKFFDVDPIAKILFKIKYSDQVQWYSDNLFSFTPDPIESTTKSIQNLKEQSVDGFVFCNLIGQLSLTHEASDDYWREFNRSFFVQLGKPFFSYHDRYAICAKKGNLNQFTKSLQGRFLLGESDIIEVCDQAQLNPKEFAMTEHFTDCIDAQNHRQVLWRKDPKTLHVIDCIWQNNI